VWSEFYCSLLGLWIRISIISLGSLYLTISLYVVSQIQLTMCWIILVSHIITPSFYFSQGHKNIHPFKHSVISCDKSTGSCICLLSVSVIFCGQGHIHDLVLLSQDRNFTCFLWLMASILVLAILVARTVITLCCINTCTLYHGPSTTDVPHTCTSSAHQGQMTSYTY